MIEVLLHQLPMMDGWNLSFPGTCLSFFPCLLSRVEGGMSSQAIMIASRERADNRIIIESGSEDAGLGVRGY